MFKFGFDALIAFIGIFLVISENFGGIDALNNVFGCGALILIIYAFIMYYKIRPCEVISPTIFLAAQIIFYYSLALIVLPCIFCCIILCCAGAIMASSDERMIQMALRDLD